MLPLVQPAAVAIALITGLGSTLAPAPSTPVWAQVSAQVSQQVSDRVTSTEITPTTDTHALSGVDASALAELRQDVADSSTTPDPATADDELAHDPGAVDRPAVLTDPMDTDLFTLAAVTWDLQAAPVGAVVDVRLREHGTWSEWLRLESGETTDAAADDVVTEGTEPLLTDGADGVQARVDTPGHLTPAGLSLVLVNGGESAGDVALGQPATTPPAVPRDIGGQTQGLAPDAVVVPAGWAPSAVTDAAQASVAQPTIITRAQWGADESLRTGSPSMSASVRGITVHHTAGTNNYTAENAAAQVRAAYAYHTQSLGWSDIGYNFLVDRFGRVYEGRAGSITQAVIGAHAGGFNVDTMGVSVIGNYETTPVTSAVVTAVGRVAGWKLAQYGANPAGTINLTSAGGGTSKFPAGTVVTLPTIFAHRHVGSTACPGDLYDHLAGIRTVAVGSPSAPAPGLPVVGDLDGNGLDEMGWFEDGEWAMLTHSGSVVRFAFGRAGDVPVFGDWDRDGKDEPGVFRAGVWHWRGSAATGPADLTFRYGRAGDRPVVGRWGGQHQDGIGVVRGNQWYTRWTVDAGSTNHTFAFARAGDRPLLGSWLTDGVARPGVVRGAEWSLSTSVMHPAAAYVLGHGRTTDRFVVADWDGDGVQNPVAVRGNTFYVRRSITDPSAAAIEFEG